MRVVGGNGTRRSSWFDVVAFTRLTDERRFRHDAGTEPSSRRMPVRDEAGASIPVNLCDGGAVLGPWIDRLVLATINQSLPEQQLDGFVLFFTLVEGDCSN